MRGGADYLDRKVPGNRRAVDHRECQNEATELRVPRCLDNSASVLEKRSGKESQRVVASSCVPAQLDDLAVLCE